MADLLELAARVEAVDPADWRALRPIAKDIYRQLFEAPELSNGSYGWREDDSGWWCQTGEDQRVPRKRIDPPKWLTSLDAAMTLVPEGYLVWAIKQDATGWWCGLSNDGGNIVKGGWAPAFSAAQAITAAALRARARAPTPNPTSLSQGEK